MTFNISFKKIKIICNNHKKSFKNLSKIASFLKAKLSLENNPKNEIVPISNFLLSNIDKKLKINLKNNKGLEMEVNKINRDC